MGFASGLTHLIVFPHARGKRCLAVDAAHAEVFDLEELLDAVFRALVSWQIGTMPLSFMAPKGRSRQWI